MVRLEQWASNGGDGRGVVAGVVYVRPEDVISIQTSVYGDATAVRTGISENSWMVVKGTPDEVHAKLFPTKVEPAPFTEEWIDDGGSRWAAMQVLEWVASEDVPANEAPSSHIVTLARKALGR